MVVKAILHLNLLAGQAGNHVGKLCSQQNLAAYCD